MHPAAAIAATIKSLVIVAALAAAGCVHRHHDLVGAERYSREVAKAIEVQPGVFLRLRHHIGEGKAFVLVHGLSSNARLWDETAAFLGHPCWAIDLRSHGESDAPETGYDTATAAADVATTIRELGLDRPVVVGQSWGGNVVVQLAAKHPELVGGVGLVDGGWIDLAANFPDWESCAKALRPSNIDGAQAGIMEKWLSESHPDWSPVARAATAFNLRVRPDGTIERRLSIEHHLQILRSMWDEPPRQYLSEITVPTLLMPNCGPDEPKAEWINATAAILKHPTISWYAGSDHDLHAQHPDRVAADLLKLVEQL